MLGAQRDPYLLPGEWQLSATYRVLRSDRHFSGVQEQVEREELGNNVVNKQLVLDLGATYAVNRRLNVTLGVPVLIYGSWAIPLPINPPGTRQTQSANGLGDITLVGRYWLLPTDQNPKGNVGLGLGVKFPTGNANAKDHFPDITGGNAQVKPVDQSVQPGDDGWGIILDFQAFRQVGSATLFASGTYLMNPRDTNNTPSIIPNLFGGNVPPGFEDFTFNSVPDQYIGRVGVAVPVPKVKGLSASLATRIEGVPVHDAIGDNNGFRRPGYSIFLEPGLIYSTGKHTFSLSVPVAVQRNREKNANGFEGDATFADYFFLVGYSYRFGGKRPAAAPTAKRAEPKRETLACAGCRFCGPLRKDLQEVRREFEQHAVQLAADRQAPAVTP